MHNLQQLYSKSRIARSELNSYDLSSLDDEIVSSATPKQIAWHLLNNVTQIPTCLNPECNNHVKWDNVENSRYSSSRGRYRSYCSAKCSNNAPDVILLKEKTSISNFGVPYHNQSEQGQQNRKKTNMAKYGVTNPSKSECVKNTKRRTTKENYGVDNPSQSPEVQSRKIKTFRERYGNTHFNNRHISKEYQEILTDPKLLKENLDAYSISHLAEIIGVNKSTIIRKIHLNGLTDYLKTSYLEQEMKTFLEELGVSFQFNTRKVIPPYELDFYLPGYKLAIEMNGDYWHSDLKKDKTYHQEKWRACDKQGVRLIQIWETDWNNNVEKFKNLVKAALGQKQRGEPARKCQIFDIDVKIARPFIEKYHLQGFVNGTHYGAYNSLFQLIGVMTFGMSRNQHFELKRWVTDVKSHAGLFSKTFKYAQKDMDFNQVVSFSANDWFTGNMYANAGFQNTGVIPPSYRYLHDGKWRHCSYFTRKGIKRKLTEFYSDDLTEFQMTNNAGILRGWDSGKKRWIWYK